MRKQLRISAVGLMMAVWAVAAQAQTDTLRIHTSAQCDMCQKRIEEALAFAKGVKYAKLDVDSKVVTVAINPKKTNAAAVKAVINKTGYDADDSPADPAAYEKLHACCKKGAH